MRVLWLFILAYNERMTSTSVFCITVVFSLLYQYVLCVCVPVLQEREGRKDMEPRSEDGQFEEVTVQQLPQVLTHTHTHAHAEWCH